MPFQIRGQAWQAFLDIPLRRTEGLYADIVGKALGPLASSSETLTLEELRCVCVGGVAEEVGSVEGAEGGRCGKWRLCMRERTDTHMHTHTHTRCRSHVASMEAPEPSSTTTPTGRDLQSEHSLGNGADGSSQDRKSGGAGRLSLSGAPSECRNGGFEILKCLESARQGWG